METRPLNLRERQMLAAILRDADGRKDRLFAAFFAAAISLGAGLLIAERLLPGSQLSQAAPVGLALLIGVLVFRRTGHEPWREKQRTDLSDELAAGVAEVTRCTARSAIRVDEFEDEGISFFMELADGRVLFLSGQYLYDLDEEKQFPNTAFTIVRTPRTRMVLEFECEGSYFPPIYTRAPFTEAEYHQGSVPSDGDIIERDFQSLRPAEAE
jgi:hypothetical protein